MLILQGILFGTYTVVLEGNFPKLTKTVFFTKVLVFAEACVFFLQRFYLFLVRQLLCEADSTAQISKATL
jgi:hypothetical protein